MSRQFIVISPYSKKLKNGQLNPKNFPYWEELVKEIRALGYYVYQVGVQCEEVINGVDKSFFNTSLSMLEGILKKEEFKTWISVDNFFHHFCASIKVPGIVIWSQSDPEIFGHKLNKNILKDRSFLRPDQFNTWECATFNAEAFPSVADIIKCI